MKPTVSRVMSFLLSLGVAEACVFLLSALAQDTRSLPVAFQNLISGHSRAATYEDNALKITWGQTGRSPAFSTNERTAKMGYLPSVPGFFSPRQLPKL